MGAPGITVIGETVVDDAEGRALGVKPITKVPLHPELRELYGDDYKPGDEQRRP